MSKRVPTDQEKFEGAIVLFIGHMGGPMTRRLAPLISKHEENLKKEDKSFHDEITNQYHVLIRRELADLIATEMFLEPDKVYSVVETLDVPAFLQSLPPLKEEN